MDKHLISTEIDRRAHQVAQNIVRLHNHQQQLERLERMKQRLAKEFLMNHKGGTIDNTILAIKAAHVALDAGESFENARKLAEQRMQELMQ